MSAAARALALAARAISSGDFRLGMTCSQLCGATQNALLAMLIVNAITVVLNRNETKPCAVTSRRIPLLVIYTSET